MLKQLFLMFILAISFTVTAKPLDNTIVELTKDIPGQIVRPKTTAELKDLFKQATFTNIPRIFVDALPSDFAKEGSPELFTQVITALILRSNEMALREKMLLAALKKKFEAQEQWTPVEESFYNSLVEKYDVITFKTKATRLEQLAQKIDEVIPGLAVAQSVYATDWGTKNMDHPYGQIGWLDDKTYADIPFDSLIKATESYVKEMNGAANYWSWRLRRQRSVYRGVKNGLARMLATELYVYRPEDPLYVSTLQAILRNNPMLGKLHEASFMEDTDKKNVK